MFTKVLQNKKIVLYFGEMEFCKYSSECVASNTTTIDNIFINNFLPSSPDVCVKVYVYGLYKCSNPSAFNNTLESFASELGLTVEDVENAFLFWQEKGLVDVIEGTNFQVRFLPVKNAVIPTQKFSKTKYGEFNKKAQELLEARMITQTEYTEYYITMENLQISPEAFLLIIDYCTQLKGKNVGYHYITTVARNWASSGNTTRESILEKIKSYNISNTEISKVLKVCGIKRSASMEEQDKYLKWTQDFGFEKNTVLYVADQIATKTGKVNFQKIDAKLTNYYEARRITIDEISDFEDNKTLMLNIAKNVCKNIGVYVDNLETVVEKYITHWIDFGHNEKSIIILADFCFKTGTRTLEGLDNLVVKLYKLGVVGESAIKEYVASIVKQDAEVKEILSRLGITRNVNSQDREFFKTWKYTWNMPTELLDLAVAKSVDKTIPMQYMNKILSTWHAKNITTVKEAENNMPTQTIFASPKPQKESWEREYKKEDLDAVFDSLEDIDI